jgi:erythronate-4-phosphate dehydrogenase
VLLVEDIVASGESGHVPPAWLAGFDLRVHPTGQPAAGPDLQAVEALLVRSTTRVTPALLELLPRLRVVATLSSGSDHIDVAALNERHLVLATGRGGNARAVAEWVIWALARLWGCGETEPDEAALAAVLGGRRVAVVGVGAVGTEVRDLLLRLGAGVLAVDPPRAGREPGFASLELREALARRPEALTLHVPLEATGPHPTVDLLGAAELARLRGAVLLNAARGGVLDEKAAAGARRSGLLRGLAVDTWQGEPGVSAEVAAAADLGTPHIAGYSVEGKLRVSWLALAALGEALALGPPPPLGPQVASVLAAGGPAPPFAALDRTAAAFRSSGLQAVDFHGLRARHRRHEWSGGLARAQPGGGSPGPGRTPRAR